MLDSTARAERLDIGSSEAPSFLWEVPQKPVAVRLPLALIDRLESEAVETFRSLSSRGSEIGGLLLGSLATGNPALVTVTDFELVPCDYSRGPLYRLSDIDLGRYERAIEKYGNGSVPRLVGYFRSHTRKGLTLDAEDLAFFEPRFLEPNQIVMLIRPFATKASTAGIFIRENGRIGENSLHEFPFRSSEINGLRPAADRAEAAIAQPSVTPAAPANKPPARAQIVPIASRREIALPEPVVQPVPSPLVQPVEAAPAAAPKGAAVAQPAETAKAAPAPAAVETPKATAPAKAPAPEVKPTPAKVAPVVEALPAEPKNKKLRLIVAAAIGMLILVGGSLVVYPSLRSRFASRPTTAQQDTSPLSLRVERTSAGMLLTWDLHSPIIQNASKVTLAITDGERHENIQLDSNQVRTGSILYTPISSDVSFQMEVSGGNNSKTTSESLRVLDPRPSPLATSDTPAPAETKSASPTKPSASTPAAETEAATETKSQEEAPAPRPALKTFNTESLAQRLRPVTTTDLPDAPTMGRSGTSLPGNLAGIVSNQSGLPAPPKPATPGSTPAPQGNSAAVISGGQLKPAVVVSRVEPEYPRLARQAGASGLVELQATIGADGHVKNPKIVRGNTMLQKAAVDAVLQWRYTPAMLNGKAVESPVEIRLNFVPAH